LHDGSGEGLKAEGWRDVEPEASKRTVGPQHGGDGNFQSGQRAINRQAVN
jgi:hypothetical protein